MCISIPNEPDWSSHSLTPHPIPPQYVIPCFHAKSNPVRFAETHVFALHDSYDGFGRASHSVRAVPLDALLYPRRSVAVPPPIVGQTARLPFPPSCQIIHTYNHTIIVIRCPEKNAS